MLKYTEVQSQQMAFIQSPSLSNNPKILNNYLIFTECKGDSGVRGSPRSFESNLLMRTPCKLVPDIPVMVAMIVMIPEMTVMDMIPLLMLTVIRTEMEISYHSYGLDVCSSSRGQLLGNTTFGRSRRVTYVDDHHVNDLVNLHVHHHIGHIVILHVHHHVGHHVNHATSVTMHPFIQAL